MFHRHHHAVSYIYIYILIYIDIYIQHIYIMYNFMLCHMIVKMVHNKAPRTNGIVSNITGGA